jgi:RNA-directed DNA polymerase
LGWLVGGADKLYREFEIKKRDGGSRKISAPIADLKGVQRTILKKVFQSFEVSAHAYAYVKGKSAVLAAKKLAGGRHVLKLDIKDFFPTISSRRVFGLLRSFGFGTKASYLLTRLCTYQGALCQGAPTSPAIANLICRKMDSELAAYAASWGIEYLRYSDDIFFSKETNFDWGRFRARVEKIIGENGFDVQHTKTRFYYRGRNRMTLGLETGGSAPKFSRVQQRNYRAAFYKASKSPKWAVENIDVLNGMLAWRGLVYGKDEKYSEYRHIIAVAGRIKLHESYSI